MQSNKETISHYLLGNKKKTLEKKVFPKQIFEYQVFKYYAGNTFIIKIGNTFYSAKI